MKLRYWMVAKAFVVLVFGVGFILIPGPLASIYGMAFNPAAALMGRLFGAGFILEAIMLWTARNAHRDNTALQGILLGVVISNLIGFLVCLFATFAGTWNALGWLSVALYLVFGAAFAYFYFGKKYS